MRVTTWNLDGLDDRHLDLRAEAACLTLLLRPDPPDVILLQEVVRRSWFAHLRPHLTAAGYTLLPASPDVAGGDYFCAVAVRAGLPIREAAREPFPGSRMGRALWTARLDWGGRDLLVATAHLESLGPARRERQAQLARVFEVLLAHPGPAVFAGDTNLRDDEVPEVPGHDRVRDAWEQLGAPGDRRYTWALRRNKKGRGAARCRFDRAYLTADLRAEGLRLLGAGRVEGTGGFCPSDHLALEVDLASASA